MKAQMKTFKKIMSLCVVTVILTLPSISFAAGDSGKQTIKKMQVSQNGRSIIYGNTGAWNNPDACDSSNYITLMPKTSAGVNEYYSEMYALIVASFLQGKEISGRLLGCTNVNGTTYPVLSNIYSY